MYHVVPATGHSLASSGDNGEIIIWKPTAPGTAPAFGASGPQTPGSAAKAVAVADGEAVTPETATAAEGGTGSPTGTATPLTPAGKQQLQASMP